jgi:hypothetical protein
MFNVEPTIFKYHKLLIYLAQTTVIINEGQKLKQVLFLPELIDCVEHKLV